MGGESVFNIAFCCLLLGLFLGFLIGGIDSPHHKTIEECEKYLPRHEKCVMVAVVDKKGGE